MGFRNCKEVHDVFTQKKSDTGDTIHRSGTNRSSTSGDRKQIEHGSRTVDRSSGWRVFKQYFLGREGMERTDLR